MFQQREVVAYWRPLGGARHGLYPDEPPYPGQQRETLCGLDMTVGSPTVVDWLGHLRILLGRGPIPPR